MKNEIRIPWPDWHTVRIIGHGAVGTVFEIRKEQFGVVESAALKVMHVPASPDEIDEKLESGNDEQTVRAYFEKCVQEIVREYSIMLELRGNANIVYCDEIRYEQQDNGIGWDVFIKMELLEPLNKISFPEYREEDVIRVAEDICSGLIQCRKHSIIHRDVKPQNIFRSRDGVYKLGDFGVSTVAENTATGTKTGTYEYMAPEIYRGQAYNLTVDIYSLGLVMYWMMNDHALPFMPVTGIPTYSEKKQGNDRRFNGETFPAPVHGSPWLRKIMEKACAYQPCDRYASAQDMLADLKRRAFTGTVLEPDTAPRQEPEKDLNLEAELTCEVRDIQKSRMVSVQAGGRQIRFPMPTGTTDGQRLCLPGLGNKDPITGRQGVLYVTVHVKASQKDRRVFWALAAAVILCAGLAIHGLMKSDEPTSTESIPAATVAPLEQLTEHVQTVPTEALTQAPETQMPVIQTPQLHVGDTFRMGSYPQRGSDDYGSPIDWIVLDVREDRALVISRYCLDSQQYHSKQVDVTWDDCTLRSWLNGVFYRAAFDEQEQERILATTVSADENPLYDTYPGMDTQDRVFVLSLSETERYMSDDMDRLCMSTPYAVENNAYVSTSSGGSWWLLRTPGESGSTVVSINSDGSVDYEGGKVSAVRGTVRPAMWIRID